MTLRELLDRVRLSDLDRTLVAALNGEEAVPLHNIVRDEDEETGERRLMLINEEESPYEEAGETEPQTLEADAGETEEDEDDGEEER